jgi:hypothetical protein
VNSPVKNINIAGINIAFLPRKQINGLRKDRKNPDIIIEECHPIPEDISLKYGNLVFDTRYWSFYHRNGHKVFVVKPSVLGPGAVILINLFNHSMINVKIYLSDSDYDWLRSWLAVAIMGNLLLLRERFIFHGCGIIDKNKGYLFLGESGAGKTTMSRLWHEKGAMVIHDDRIIVYKKGPEFLMTGLNIHRRTKFRVCRPEKKAVLSKIFFIKHGPKNTLLKKGQLDAFKAIANNQPILACDKKVLKNMLYFYSDLTKTIPVSDLAFAPDFKCIDFIRGS